MNDDLIERLSADLKPVRATALLERLALVVMGGLVVSGALMWIWLGLRPDMGEATGSGIFWIKSSYTLVLGVLGVWGVERFGRPGSRGSAPLTCAFACFAVIAAAAIVDYATAPEHARAQMLMGSTASVCPIYIGVLSLPLLFVTVAFMRKLAPTNPTLAGAAAGLATGGLGAWIYSFHCTEPGLPFLASWYSLGIVAVVMLGALAGRFLLRW